MSGDKTYLEEAFQKLNTLDELHEDVFELTDSGLVDADNFMKIDFDDVEEVIDTEAESREELKDSYLGNVILNCNVCNSKIYKRPEEVIIDEEGVANIEETCPYCQSNDGYLVIGQVAEYCDHCDDEDKEEEHKEEKEEDSEEIKVDETEEEKIEESLKESKQLNEEVPSEAYEVAEYIDNLAKDRNLISYKDFNGLFDDAVRNLGVAREIYQDADFESDVRGVLSFKGWETEFEGDNEGGLKLLESSMRDKIDANKDNKIEKARKNLSRKLDDADSLRDERRKTARKDYRKTQDDADADRDYRLKKANLKESDKPAATSIEDAQKWVDYDMKKYGKISGRTNRLVKKAGFQILKDDHGDYEVAAGKFESMKEDFERVDIETDRERMSMSADENGKVTVTTEPKEEVEAEVEEKEEVIEPVSDEVRDEFKSSEDNKFQDVEIDEFEEDEFDTLGEQYLRKVYENVKSFKTTKGAVRGNTLKLEGLITFKSGKQAKTNFVFEAATITRRGKLKFIGENKQFAKGKKSFTLTGKLDGKKLVSESLTYNYKVKDNTGNTKRLYGRVVR